MNPRWRPAILFDGELSKRVGLAEQTSFRHGSATDLPFEDASFDVAWTEHVQMNIADKQRFYAEVARVLKPGGQLLFHDIFAGPGCNDGFLYPVPWAAEASISHLAPPDEVRDVLASVGFAIEYWQDNTEASIAFIDEVLAKAARGERPALGLHVIVGTETAPAKFTNMRDNFASDRLRVIEARVVRS